MSSHNQAPLKTEFLTVLLPERRADGSEARARKVWCIGPSGSPEALGYDLRRVAFRVEPRPIASLGDAVAIIEKVAAHGRGFWVRGEHVGSRTRFQRRRWRPEPGKPATLDDVPKRLALFDMDGVPNVEGLDPRTEPVRAAEWLAELLGGDFRRAALHVRFSSSSCVGLPHGEAPPTLSAHIYAWLDEPLGHAELKAIVLALNARTIGNLPECVRTGTARMVDWKVTEPQQPCYVVPPEFRDGLVDPFAGGCRAVTLEDGRSSALSVASLRHALAGLSMEPTRVPQRKTTRTKRAPKGGDQPAIAPRTCLPLSVFDDAGPEWSDELAAVLAGAEAARTSSSPRQTKAAVVRADRRRGAARAVRELARIVRARSGPWGEAHAEFSHWAHAGRVPEGERDLWAHAGAALLAQAASADQAKEGTLARATDQLATILCGEDWTVCEWRSGGFAGSTLRRAVSSAKGETVVSPTGRTVDPRYGYSMSTLRTLLSIGDDECAAAGLISLSPPEIAAHVRRWSATNQCPSQEMAERERAWRRVRRLARSGLSVREISKRADIPVTTVHRMMNSPRPRQLKERFFLRGIEFSVGQVFQVCRHLVIEEEREKEVLAVKRDVAEVIQPASPEEASLRQGGGPAPLRERPRTAGVSATPGNPSDAIRLDGRGKAAIAARTAEAAWAALAEIPDDDERVAVLGVLNALAAERSFLTVRGAAPTKARPTQRIPASIVALRFKSSFAALDTAMRSADEAWLTAIERQAKRHKRTVALLDRWEFGESLRGKSDDEVIELVRRRGVAARTLWFGLSSAALARASKLAGRSLRPRECDDAMKHRRALASVLKADRDEVRRMGLGRQLTARCLEHLWPDAADQARPAVRSEPRLDAVVSPHVALARLRAHAASLST